MFASQELELSDLFRTFSKFASNVIYFEHKFPLSVRKRSYMNLLKLLYLEKNTVITSNFMFYIEVALWASAHW